MANTLALIHPTLDLCADFRDLAREFLAEGDDRYREAAHDVRAFVEMCADHSVGRNLPADWVPQTGPESPRGLP
jgi:hypothetical protein